MHAFLAAHGPDIFWAIFTFILCLGLLGFGAMHRR